MRSHWAHVSQEAPQIVCYVQIMCGFMLTLKINANRNLTKRNVNMRLIDCETWLAGKRKRERVLWLDLWNFLLHKRMESRIWVNTFLFFFFFSKFTTSQVDMALLLRYFRIFYIRFSIVELILIFGTQASSKHLNSLFPSSIYIISSNPLKWKQLLRMRLTLMLLYAITTLVHPSSHARSVSADVKQTLSKFILTSIFHTPMRAFHRQTGVKLKVMPRP